EREEVRDPRYRPAQQPSLAEHLGQVGTQPAHHAVGSAGRWLTGPDQPVQPPHAPSRQADGRGGQYQADGQTYGHCSSSRAWPAHHLAEYVARREPTPSVKFDAITICIRFLVATPWAGWVAREPGGSAPVPPASWLAGGGWSGPSIGCRRPLNRR